MGFGVKTRTLSWIEESLDAAGRLKRVNLYGHDDDMWMGATIDSRGECSHRVFFALGGEHTDGHCFVDDARSKGSWASVIEREDVADALEQAEAPFVLVDDVLASLQVLSPRTCGHPILMGIYTMEQTRIWS